LWYSYEVAHFRGVLEVVALIVLKLAHEALLEEEAAVLNKSHNFQALLLKRKAGMEIKLQMF